MRRSLRALTACFVVMIGVGTDVTVGTGHAVARTDPRSPPPALPDPLGAVRTWAFAIGSGDLDGSMAERLRAYDLVVVDGEEATPAKITALHAQGTIVLGYLDVGAIEPGRPWSRRAKPYRLDYWEDWGEWFADVSDAGYRDLIAGSVAPPMLAKGFDGLFLDNIDMISDHPAQTEGMHTLVGALARLVHGDPARRHFLFAQNGDDVIGPMLGDLDGWNREDVSRTYDFDRSQYVRQTPGAQRAALAALRRVRAAGLLVTATDYLPASDGGAAAAEAVRVACAAGALPFVSDLDLRRIPPRPETCAADG